MTPEILDLLFPNKLPTVDEILAKYPPRQLPEGACVTRVGPSPTGNMHIGTLYQALCAERVAHQSGGVFFLRLEDTDQKRELEGAAELIVSSLSRYGIHLDEGAGPNGTDIGNYGPYTQSKRKEIYQAFAKSLAEKGLAYPCFCTEEDVEMRRKIQTKQGLRPGYYGVHAKCRTLTDEEVLANLKAGKPWVLRFKSPGKYENRITIKDLIRGNLSMPENDMDIVIIKGDGLPTYHFAHAVDDHLMGTTIVSRADEWIASLPLHVQLFTALGWEPPKYAHLAPIQKIDNGSRRKLSKRLDPEASIAYYWECGYPEEAQVEYLLNLLNASFEDWRRANPTLPAFDFVMNFNKISNTAGALFDMVKLNSIAREVVARMSAEEVYDKVLTWAKEYKPEYAALLENNREKCIAIFNIERGIGAKSRKDLFKWEDAEHETEFFFNRPAYDESLLAPMTHADIQKVAADFATIYDPADDNQAWFAKVKQVAEQNGFATDMKAYKADPSGFKGSVADVAKILRVAITGRTQSPDLCSIMKILGKEEVVERLKING